MKPIGPMQQDWQTVTANAAWRARALEKPKAAANLHGERDDEAQEQRQQQRRRADITVTQSGTAQPVPFRYAPRLTAPFTAQLLGQILPDRERRFSQAASYGAQRPRLVLGLDTRL